MKILAVGDSYMPLNYFRDALAGLESAHEIAYLQADAARPVVLATDSDRRISEYEGSPEELREHIKGVQVLLVHGAPVTEAVIAAADDLVLVGCARGGPSNIDVGALNSAGIPLVNTPGKNAHAVADLTLAFAVTLARGLPTAQRFLEAGNRLRNNWEGAQFMGHDLGGHTLGLVGCGDVGRQVAIRALAFGMRVHAYDPYIQRAPVAGVELVESLEQLLGCSDFVSIHARSTPENQRMLDARAFAAMKPGAYFINTAREGLVDETALDDALASGRLGGAALDVFDDSIDGQRHRLLRHDNVVLTPHMGGATAETLIRGARRLAREVARFIAAEPLVNVVNPQVLVAR